MWRELVKYAEELSGEEPECMRWVKAASAQRLVHDDMLSGAVTGNLLSMLVKWSGAHTILELGTHTGYATLWMASALPENGTITTVDSNLKYLAIAREGFARSPWREKINSVHANAPDWIVKYDEHPDLVYIDADKRSYPLYFERLRSRITKGGVLVADNVFWKGGVLNPVEPKAQAVDTFNRMVLADPDFDSVILPLRDGVLLARKRT